MGAAGPQTVPVQGNPLTPINVDAGTYTMTATSPPNFTLVACGGSSTPNSDGSSATESVNVPSGGAGVGHLLRDGDLHDAGDDADHADLAADDITEPDDADDRSDDIALDGEHGPGLHSPSPVRRWARSGCSASER